MHAFPRGYTDRVSKLRSVYVLFFSAFMEKIKEQFIEGIVKLRLELCN